MSGAGFRGFAGVAVAVLAAFGLGDIAINEGGRLLNDAAIHKSATIVEPAAGIASGTAPAPVSVPVSAPTPTPTPTPTVASASGSRTDAQPQAEQAPVIIQEGDAGRAATTVGTPSAPSEAIRMAADNSAPSVAGTISFPATGGAGLAIGGAQPHTELQPAGGNAGMAGVGEATGGKSGSGPLEDVASRLLKAVQAAVSDKQPEEGDAKAPAASAAPAVPSAPAAPDTAAAKVGDAGVAAQPVEKAAAAGAEKSLTHMPSVVLSFAEMKYVDKGGTAGDVVVSGRSEAGASLRFMIDGVALGKTKADTQGVWELRAEKQLAVGPHWITAEQLDRSGEVVARAESPFDRDAPAAPAASAAPPQPEAQVAAQTPTQTPPPASAPTSAPAPLPVAPSPEASASGETTTSPTAPAQPVPATTAGGAAPETAAPAMAGTAAAPAAGDAATAAGGQAPAPAAEGIKDTASRIWDKFTGIFGVDQPGQQQDGTTTLPEQQQAAAADGAGMAGTGAATATATATGDKPQGGNALAFTGVTHRAGRDGEVLELAGVAEPGSRVRLYEDTRKLGDVVADRSGNWSFRKKGKVAAGPHLFRAGRLLKSGRIAAEVRLQYDHVATAATAALPASDPAANEADKAAAVPTDKMAGAAVAGISARGQAAVKKSQKKAAASAGGKATGKSAQRGSAKGQATAARLASDARGRRVKRGSAYAVGKPAADYSPARKDKSKYLARRGTSKKGLSAARKEDRSSRKPVTTAIDNAALMRLAEHRCGKRRVVAIVQPLPSPKGRDRDREEKKIFIYCAR